MPAGKAKPNKPAPTVKSKPKGTPMQKQPSGPKRAKAAAMSRKPKKLLTSVDTEVVKVLRTLSLTNGTFCSLRDVQLNITNLKRTINAILQMALALGGDTQYTDAQSNDFANAATLMYYDLTQNALTGGPTVFNDMPLFYRELFEAMSPHVSQGAWQESYKFVSEGFGNFNEVDGVLWGSINDTVLTSGYTTINVFQPSASQTDQLTSCSRIFNRFYAARYPKWKIGDDATFAMKDCSVFAYFTAAPPTQQEFLGVGGTTSSEVPITNMWLAGLQLTMEDSTRMPNYTKCIYAGSQTYMGHRLLTKDTGKRGSYDQVRIQRIDIAELMIMALGTMAGVNLMRSESQGGPDTIAYGDSVSGQGIDVANLYLRFFVAWAALAESPATLGYFDPANNFLPLPWGNQFLMPDDSSVGDWSHFQLVIENLRRLKCVSQKYRGVPTYIYNVFTSSNYDTAFNYNATANLTLTANLTSPLINYLTMRTAASVAICYNSFNAGALANYQLSFSQTITTGNSYTAFATGYDQVEGGERGCGGPLQQVSWFMRVVVPSNFVAETSDNVACTKVMNQWKMAIAGKGLQRKDSKGKIEIVAPPPLSGISLAMTYRKPYTPEQSFYTALVCPITYCAGLASSTFGNLSAVAHSRHMMTSWKQSNLGYQLYLNNFNAVGSQQVHGPGNEGSGELMKKLAQNENFGLGGAVSDAALWLSKKIGKKHPKLGKIVNTLGAMGDSAIKGSKMAGLDEALGAFTPMLLSL